MVLFQAVLVVFAAVEATHRRELLLYPLEKSQDSVALRWEVELGIDVHIKIKTVAKGTVIV